MGLHRRQRSARVVLAAYGGGLDDDYCHQSGRGGGAGVARIPSLATRSLLLTLATLTLLAVLLGFGALGATPAHAESLKPWWHMTSSVRPAVLKPGQEGLIDFRASNLGDGAATGCTEVAEGTGKYPSSECYSEEPGNWESTPIVFTATLPEGVSVQQLSGEPNVLVNYKREPLVSGQPACTEPGPRRIRCVYEKDLLPSEYLEISIAVVIAPDAHSGISTAEVTGGQTPAASVERKLSVGEGATPFGTEEAGFSLVPEEVGGAVDARAGSHPFQVTTTFALNQNAPEELSGLAGQALHPPALPKDLTFSLPPGLVANAVAFPRCSEFEFLTKSIAAANLGDACPADTAVGEVLLTIDEPAFGGLKTLPVPVFNLAPKQGEPVRFGFYLLGASVLIDFHIRTGEDYGATATVTNITQLVNFVSEQLTIWGVPGEPVHDSARGWGCIDGGFYAGPGSSCTRSSATQATPFLTLPTSCQEPWAASVSGDSWPTKADPAGVRFPANPQPGSEPASEYALKDSFGRQIGLTGCNQLAFDPSIEVAPDVEDASSASGLTVNVKVPQEVSENASGLASSSVRDITVALPAGVAVNPSGGNGLEACTSNQGDQPETPGNQIGWQGYKPFASVPETKLPTFSPRLPGSIPAGEAGEMAPLQPGVNFCSTASKIGTVEIHSSLIKEPLVGAVYLASQNQNPFGSLLAMYIVAEDREAGVLVKLPGEVQLCQGAGEVIAGMTCGVTGQLVSTFANNPQLPFEDAELHFFGGERAPLATPARCGTYTTHATFAPWSGTVPVTATSSFDISSGPNGSPCPGASLPFSPSLTGGATNLNAGAFSPFTLTLTRKDGEQNMQSVQAQLPLGMSGDLSNVEQCPEPQANLGECGPNSLIGETTVSVGVGGDPYSVSGGKFYLTGPYNGTGGCTVGSSGCAPFGVTFEVPAKAGPFDLERNSANPAGEDACDCVIVRGKIEINPETAAITVTSNPPGTPYAIPTSIEGIPLEIQHINAITTRTDFQFNPTNCSKLEASGTIHSSEGATDTVGVPFQVTNCADLKFEPKVAISTQGKTSKADGASLTYKLTYPNVPQGTDADIHYVKVELPKALPSRLTTLQKACTQPQFKANPAGCPSASDIGHAKAIVPNIPVPLEGPVYFVSNGGEAFPNLVIVLQGYNVTIDLIGDTFISKSGITSTTFKTVPDNPVYTFEITLPEGKYSALAANGNLCKLTTTKTVSKKVKVKVKGREKTEVRTVKETVPGSLVMPNEYIAQNGMKITKTVPISVTGCRKAVKVTKHKKKKKQARKSTNDRRAH